MRFRPIALLVLALAPASCAEERFDTKSACFDQLEAVLERVNAIRFRADTLHVMSAFRTPYYNHAIGDVKDSMRQWGSAADIFVDPLEKDRRGMGFYPLKVRSRK